MLQGPLASLFWRPIVHALCYHVPPTIDIGKIPTVDGRRGGEGKHNGGHVGELVVESPCLVDVTRLEGNLETTAAHAKGHCVHVYVVRKRGARMCLNILRVGITLGNGGINEGPRGIGVMKNGY